GGSRMRRPRFGSALVAVALATAALVPILAAPASAAPACPNVGIYPKSPGGESGLKVGCTTAGTDSVTALTVHDAANATWHRGAARNVVVNTTSGSTAITYAAGVLAIADVRRPISGPGIAAGAFIRSVVGTTATLSRASTATATGVTALIEHTQARV